MTNKNDSKKIYCDESGISGANLMDEKQPYFTFASNDISEETSRTILKELKVRFDLSAFVEGNGEIKGNELAKDEIGQKALIWILEECKDNFFVSVSLKKFALVAKPFICHLFRFLIISKKPFSTGDFIVFSLMD